MWGAQGPQGAGTPGGQGRAGAGPPGLCGHSRPSRSLSDSDSLPPAGWGLTLLVPLRHPGAGFQRGCGSAFSQLLRNLSFRMTEGTGDSPTPRCCCLPCPGHGVPLKVSPSTRSFCKTRKWENDESGEVLVASAPRSLTLPPAKPFPRAFLWGYILTQNGER